ncbi:MAG TPA: DUF2058 family protein [Myxococcota bacterium]
MLDLKAQLLKAGLVTEDQVKRVEEQQRDTRDKNKRPPASSTGERQLWQKRLDELKAGAKSEQYDAIRGWVDRHRIDAKVKIPSEHASRFHFARDDGSIGHVTLEPDVRDKLAAGEAGLVAFMGNNGIEHAVVPKDLAQDIAHVKPEWLRALAGVTTE